VFDTDALLTPARKNTISKIATTDINRPVCTVTLDLQYAQWEIPPTRILTPNDVIDHRAGSLECSLVGALINVVDIMALTQRLANRRERTLLNDHYPTSIKNDK